MTTETTAPADLAENIRIAQGLIRTLAEQDAAVKFAYAKGWGECGEALAYTAAEAWEAGYDAATADRQAEWEQLQKQIHKLGAQNYATFEDRRAAELAACRPREGDFLGVGQDPQYIARCRASLEPTIRATPQRAA